MNWMQIVINQVRRWRNNSNKRCDTFFPSKIQILYGIVGVFIKLVVFIIWNVDITLDCVQLTPKEFAQKVHSILQRDFIY